MIPRLDAPELAAELEKLFQAATPRPGTQPRRFVAICGLAERQRITTRTCGEVEVIPARSELELRRHLPALHEEHGFVAFALSWPVRELPVDIAGRFLHRGRVHRLAQDDRLRNLFGGTKGHIAVDGELERARLGAYLIARYPADSFPAPAAGRITLDGAWTAWLGATWGLDAGPALGLDTLLAWAATNARGPQLAAELATEPARGVQAELEAFLRRRVGDAGPIVLRCWLAGRGAMLMKFAALFEVAVDDPARAPIGAIRSVALAQLGVSDRDLDTMLEPLGKGAGAAFRALAHVTSPQAVATLLTDAQALVSASEHAGLAASPRLPIAWSLRLDRLGAALRAGAHAPGHATLDDAIQALRALDKHEAYLRDEHRRTLERAEMATRLLAWLVARPDQRLPAGPQSYADAQRLASWYAQEGGYVDWARRRARGGGDTTFARGIEAVLTAADDARLEIDRRFARAYVEWLRSDRPRVPLLPIDAAVATFVAPYLEGHDGRRMLVLLMDGMAWAQAVEILQALGRDHAPWHPIAWNTLALPGAGNVSFTPVLAQLPSVTKVSRSAFFAGHRIEAGTNTDKLKDAKLWEDHKALAKFYTGTGAPKLRDKDSGFETSGAVTQPTLNLIQDERQPVVALIVNAIDDHLKSTTQEDHSWTDGPLMDTLRQLLAAAHQAGRAVVLAADHGHVSGQRLQYAATPASDGRGTRWRPWKRGDTVHEYEIEIESAYAWAPKGEATQGIVLLADDRHSYGTQRHYGEHGGATLAEVVAPLVVLGNDALQPATTHDPALEPRPLHPPAWWLLDIAPTTTTPLAEPPPPKRPRSKTAEKEAQGQLAMPGIKAPEAPTPAPVEGPHVSSATRALLDKLAKNALFNARAEHPGRRANTLKALELLLERNNTVPAATFAAALGVSDYRVGGLVSQLGEILNVDGYEVIVHDSGSRLVTLNAAQLRQGFGV